jgi:peptidoglycan/xylan/chitin deacetylase (PgdA/CDA1 family)
MMKQQSTLALFAAFAFALVLAPRAHAELEFHGLDLGKNDALLFSARAELPSGGSYDALFLSDLAKGGISAMTMYPERISLVDAGRKIQVQNRFGLFRTDQAMSSLSPVPGYPSFARGAVVRPGKLIPCATSADGIYVLSVVPISAAYARLVLFDTVRSQEYTVSSKVEFSMDEFPARWSPDSRNFVYAKGGSLFYFSIEQYVGGRVMDEDFRRIGDGRIQCARWSADGSLFYIRSTALFRILPAEFFTQALYRGIAGMGVLAGNTPFPFDPNFDDFWVSPEGARVILSKGGRNLFLLYLDPDDFGSEARVTALPYLFLQGDTMVRDVLWPRGGDVTVFTGSLRDGQRKAGAYRFSAPSNPSLLDLAPKVASLDVADASELALSPSQTKVAVIKADGVVVRDYADWSVKAELKAPNTVHALWISETRIVVAGSALIETIDVASGVRNLVAISQAEAYGRADDGSVLVKAGGSPYKRQLDSPVWLAQPSFPSISASTSSSAYRVYLDALAAGAYRNTVMVRSLKALGTNPLFPPPPTTYAPFPDRDEPRVSAAFDHGSRIRRREVSLVVNAIDSADGLAGVLDVLKDYSIKTTFFVNGDFIARNPGAARLLAGSGHELGSMFFTAVDPTDARFRIDRDYVRRGLARTEDDWFAATGKELSLLWHTPYYTTNSDILEAGASMNYTYVGRDVDPLDWVGKADAAKLPGSYIPAPQIIENILSRAKPGSIIPIRLGIPDGGRDDYLFRELALLVDALIGAGYDIVPVSDLIEHAQ